MAGKPEPLDLTEEQLNEVYEAVFLDDDPARAARIITSAPNFRKSIIRMEVDGIEIERPQ